MKILIFLQNAYSKEYAGKKWPRNSWIKALRNSRSGKRLSVLESRLSNHQLFFDNTTRDVGDHPDSILPPDYDHMKWAITRICPSMIITCGSQAFAAINIIAPSKPILAIPHPAFRVVTNQLFITAADVVERGFKGIVRLHQLKGEVKCEVC
jgi:hypothetical protein